MRESISVKPMNRSNSSTHVTPVVFEDPDQHVVRAAWMEVGGVASLRMETWEDPGGE